MLRERSARAGVGLLDPDHLDLRGGDPGPGESRVDRAEELPGAGGVVGDPVGRHPRLGAVDDHQLGADLRVVRDEPPKRRELDRGIRHADRKQHDATVFGRDAVAVERSQPGPPAFERGEHARPLLGEARRRDRLVGPDLIARKSRLGVRDNSPELPL